MNQEFDALHTNHTWNLVPFPACKKTIGYKWMYIFKHKDDDDVERFKKGL